MLFFIFSNCAKCFSFCFRFTSTSHPITLVRWDPMNLPRMYGWPSDKLGKAVWNFDPDYENQEEFQPETQMYDEHSDMFSRFNQNMISSPNNQNNIESQFTPLPSLSYMGDYHQDNNITALPERQNNQISEFETPMPMTRNSIIGSNAFRQVSRNFNQFENQFNDPFFK